MFELPVITMILHVCDQLLFMMLGGQDRTEAPCSVDVLVDKTDSLIGKVLAQLRDLLRDWSTTNPLRRPWML